jgi:S1-C subfamily serine protease
MSKVNKVQQLVDQAGVGSELQVQLRRNGRTVALTIKPDQLPPIASR